MELFHANQQWSTRPADERFTSLEAMHTATLAYAQVSIERSVPWSDLRVEASGGTELALVGKAGVPAQLTHYAFGQLSARVGAPAGYLRDLPATLAAQNLNHGLKDKGTDNAQLLFHRNGGLLLRAATSDKYSRYWNWELCERLREVEACYNMEPAKPTIRVDSFGAADQRALFASDHDMFAFLMTRERAVIDPMGQEMYRGIIAVNSEVGAAALKIMAFYFRDVCGNFIIWGAEQIAEISLRHVGDIHKGWRNAQVSVRRYLDGAASIETAKFAEMTRTIAGTKDEVLDKVFGLRINELSRKVLSESYDAVVPSQDGARNTVWGLAQGITRVSQQETFADERNRLDRGAGKLLAAAFKF